MLSSVFHDGKLLSISVIDGSLVLQVFAKNKSTKIQIVGLEKLRVTDFKEGNIINTMRVFCGGQPSEDENTRISLIKYAYDISDTALERSEKLSLFLDAKVREIEIGSLLILEVEPSYGSYIVAIGRAVLEEDSSI